MKEAIEIIATTVSLMAVVWVGASAISESEHQRSTAASPNSGPPLPRYDVEGDCVRYGAEMTVITYATGAAKAHEQGLQRAEGRKRCLREMQEEYNNLIHGMGHGIGFDGSAFVGVDLLPWGQLPAATRTTCIAQVERKVGEERDGHAITAYRYRYLRKCLADETAQERRATAAQTVPRFKP